jgi:hypothetical protein
MPDHVERTDFPATLGRERKPVADVKYLHVNIVAADKYSSRGKVKIEFIQSPMGDDSNAKSALQSCPELMHDTL